MLNLVIAALLEAIEKRGWPMQQTCASGTSEAAGLVRRSGRRTIAHAPLDVVFEHGAGLINRLCRDLDETVAAIYERGE
jgi:hypothetical protein